MDASTLDVFNVCIFTTLVVIKDERMMSSEGTNMPFVDVVNT